MRITLTRAAGGHANGATIERNAKVARLLIGSGAAVEAEQDEHATSNDASDDEPKPKRTRRSASRKGKSDERNEAQTSDETAGQGGGGVPLEPPAPTAG